MILIGMPTSSDSFRKFTLADVSVDEVWVYFMYGQEVKGVQVRVLGAVVYIKQFKHHQPQDSNL